MEQCDGEDTFRFKMTCSSTLTHSLGDENDNENTSYKKTDGKLEDLMTLSDSEATWMGCKDGFVLKGWKMQASNTDDTKSMMVSHCQETARVEDDEHLEMTGCQKGPEMTLEKLRHHEVMCGDSQALKKWRLTGDGCSEDRLRFEYVCYDYVDPRTVDENGLVKMASSKSSSFLGVGDWGPDSFEAIW